MKKLQLSIPEPCHEDWGKMTNAEKGRFCNSCEKVVVDFSAMSERQLVEFFKKPAGSVCGRFQQDQLEREIVIPRKRIPWIKYFFQFALPAFLVSIKAEAQQTKGKVAAIVCSKDAPNKAAHNTGDTLKPKAIIPNANPDVRVTLGMVAPNPFRSITGKITDEKGFPVPHASVMIKGTSTSVACNAKGNFKLDIGNRMNVILVVSAIGFKSQEVTTDNKTEVTVNLKMQEMGEVVVVIAGRVNVNKLSPKKSEPRVITGKLKDSVLNGIKFYPNPAFTNGQINIEWTDAEKGDYDIYFVNKAGQQVHKTELVVLMKKTITSGFFLTALKNGIYFVTITNRKTKKSFTEKLLVENKTF